MAKKKKKNEQLPEGMSRRQAKLAARAAERAALEKEPRPYAGLACESQLVALQEFVPSAIAKLPVKGFDRDVYVATVLPGATAALIRDEQSGGAAFVGLQVQSHTHNPGRDLAFALNWVKNAEPGSSLESTAADGSQPPLTELLGGDDALDIEVYQDFSWWMPEGAQVSPQVAQSLQMANDSVVPSEQVGVEAGITGTAFWANAGGGKAHIRWVRPNDNEPALLNALARAAAAGKLNLGEDTKFAGVFRTHGLVAPVFDLHNPDKPAADYEPELRRVDELLNQEIDNDAPLTAEERRQLENIKSRQVTLR